LSVTTPNLSREMSSGADLAINPTRNTFSMVMFILWIFPLGRKPSSGFDRRISQQKRLRAAKSPSSSPGSPLPASAFADRRLPLAERSGRTDRHLPGGYAPAGPDVRLRGAARHEPGGRGAGPGGGRIPERLRGLDVDASLGGDAPDLAPPERNDVGQPVRPPRRVRRHSPGALPEGRLADGGIHRGWKPLRRPARLPAGVRRLRGDHRRQRNLEAERAAGHGFGSPVPRPAEFVSILPVRSCRRSAPSVCPRGRQPESLLRGEAGRAADG